MDVIELEPDIINIGDLEEPNLRLEENETDIRPSVNFGSGIELLMNDKKTEKKSSSNVEIDDITKLEDELNDLTESITEPNDNKKINEGSSKSIYGGLFGTNNKDGSNVRNVSGNEDNKQDNLGKSTSNMNENKTWDGFGKFNNVPVNMEKVAKEPELSKEEELKEKFKYLRKLEELEKKMYHYKKDIVWIQS